MNTGQHLEDREAKRSVRAYEMNGWNEITFGIFEVAVFGNGM